MQFKLFSKENLTSPTGLVVVGAATGAVTGIAAMVTYSLIAGKGTGAWLALKSIFSAPAAASTTAAGTTAATAAPLTASTTTTAFTPFAASITSSAPIATTTTATAPVAASTAVVAPAVAAANSASNLSSLGSNLMSLLIPASAGMAGGGASGLGIAKKIAHDQLEKAKEMIAEQANDLQERLQTLETRVEAELTPTPAAEPPPPPPPRVPSELEQIKGIGPKLAGLLQEAGISTLEDLAQSNAQTLQTILDNSRVKQLFKLEDWLTQAQHLIEQKQPTPPTTPTDET